MAEPLRRGLCIRPATSEKTTGDETSGDRGGDETSAAKDADEVRDVLEEYVEVRRRILREHSGHVLDSWPLPAD